jgi:SWI/SNF-related matrix-associated actin-dependent regulator 1 of chromatin subfamily A
MYGSKQLSLLGALVVLAACGSGGTNVKGHVSDQSGSQAQAATAGITSLGGEGTASAAAKANAYTVGSDGALSLVASAEVDAQGDFSLSVPDGAQKLVIQAADADGKVVASVLAVQAGASGTVEQLPPMTSETSLEAQVLVQMVKQGVSLQEANAVDLETRIGAELAAQVQAQEAGGADVSQTVADLATAVAAAQKTEVETYAQHNLALSQSAIFDAEVEAGTALEAKLAGGTDAQAAYDAFFQAIAEAKAGLGVDAQTQSKGQRDSGAAFNVVVEARLGANANAETALIADAAIRTEAALEARLAGAAVDAILAGGEAAAQASAAAGDAVTALRAQVGAASSVGAASAAYTAFAASVSGSADLSTSVVGTYLDVQASNQLALQAAVDASAVASTSLTAAVDQTFELAGSAAGALDVSAFAGQIAQAYAAYDSALQAQVVALGQFGAQAQPAVDLLVVAQGSFIVQ